MPYQLEWYIHKRVIFKRFWGTLTEHDLRSYYERYFELDAEGIPPIHLITYDGEIEQIPVIPDQFKWNRQLKKHMSDTAMIGQPTFAVGLITLISRILLRKPVQFFRTADEAKAYLKKKYPELDWENANDTLFEQE